MVEFKCLGHDSRKQHACRSVLVAPGGFCLMDYFTFLEKIRLYLTK